MNESRKKAIASGLLCILLWSVFFIIADLIEGDSKKLSWTEMTTLGLAWICFVFAWPEKFIVSPAKIFKFALVLLGAVVAFGIGGHFYESQKSDSYVYKLESKIGHLNEQFRIVGTHLDALRDAQSDDQILDAAKTIKSKMRPK